MKPSQKLPFTALLQGRHPQLADEETEVRDGDVMNSKSYNMEVMELGSDTRTLQLSCTRQQVSKMAGSECRGQLA